MGRDDTYTIPGYVTRRLDQIEIFDALRENEPSDTPAISDQGILEDKSRKGGGGDKLSDEDFRGILVDAKVRDSLMASKIANAFYASGRESARKGRSHEEREGIFGIRLKNYFLYECSDHMRNFLRIDTSSPSPKSRDELTRIARCAYQKGFDSYGKRGRK